MTIDGACASGGVAVITGAGSGFGAAIAHQCAADGLAVAALDISAASAEATASSLRDRGAAAIAISVDVADREALARAAEIVTRELGRCELLFANVGVQQFGSLDRLTPDDWQWLLSVNVLGTVQTVDAFLPLMRNTVGHRHIVLTSSDSVLAPTPRIGGYIVTKAAVMSYGDVLRLELADEDIAVTVLFPSGMTTNHLDSSRAARPAKLGPSMLHLDDLAYVSTHAAPGPDDIATPQSAAAGVLLQVRANVPFVVTHGSSRDRFEPRVQQLLAAYQSMVERRSAQKSIDLPVQIA